MIYRTRSCYKSLLNILRESRTVVERLLGMSLHSNILFWNTHQAVHARTLIAQGDYLHHHPWNYKIRGRFDLVNTRSKL